MSLLEVVAPLVGSSPRRAKRFLNLYRVIKARVLTDPKLQGQLSRTGATGLMVVTALALGLLSVQDWLTACRDPGTSTADYQRLTDFISAVGHEAGLSMADLQAWLPLVQRYVWPITARDKY